MQKPRPLVSMISERGDDTRKKERRLRKKGKPSHGSLGDGATARAHEARKEKKKKRPGGDLLSRGEPQYHRRGSA